MDEDDELRPITRYLLDHPRLLRAALRPVAAARLAHLRAFGMPETTTREDVLQSSAKRKMVAKAVYEELFGRQESERKINGGKDHSRRVEDRFPGGYTEIEPIVEDLARAGDDNLPYRAALRRIDKELKREHRNRRT